MKPVHLLAPARKCAGVEIGRFRKKERACGLVRLWTKPPGCTERDTLDESSAAPLLKWALLIRGPLQVLIVQHFAKRAVLLFAGPELFLQAFLFPLPFTVSCIGRRAPIYPASALSTAMLGVACVRLPLYHWASTVKRQITSRTHEVNATYFWPAVTCLSVRRARRLLRVRPGLRP
jgi:hypothetical protein